MDKVSCFGVLYVCLESLPISATGMQVLPGLYVGRCPSKEKRCVSR